MIVQEDIKKKSTAGDDFNQFILSQMTSNENKQGRQAKDYMIK